jgi:hypothetical protein
MREREREGERERVRRACAREAKEAADLAGRRKREAKETANAPTQTDGQAGR